MRLGGPSVATVKDIALRIVVILAALAAWKLATERSDSLFFPPPDKILSAVWNDWILAWSDTWPDSVGPSLRRLLSGYLLAAVASISLGVAIGRSKHLGEYIEPIIHFVRAIPPPALLPLFMVLLGLDDNMKIALIATGVFPPILLNTMDGVRSIDPLYLETASSYRIGRLRRVTHVILPAAAPKIFAGLRISMSLAVILMVISELIAATDGVGHRLVQSQRLFKMVDLWAGLVVLGAMGAILNGGLALIERRVLRWTRS